MKDQEIKQNHGDGSPRSQEAIQKRLPAGGEFRAGWRGVEAETGSIEERLAQAEVLGWD